MYKQFAYKDTLFLANCIKNKKKKVPLQTK